MKYSTKRFERMYEIRKQVIYAKGYSMSDKRIFQIYGADILEFWPDVYYKLNSKVGYPEGAD